MKNNFTFCCNCDLKYRIFHIETTLSNFFQHPFSLSSPFCDEQSELSSTICRHYSQKLTPTSSQLVLRCYETSLLQLLEERVWWGKEVWKLDSLWVYYSSYFILNSLITVLWSNSRITMKVGQCVCVDWLLFLHHCCYHGTHYWFIHHFCGLSLQ